MRHAEIAAVVMLAWPSAFAQQQSTTKVHTALNHLTVIELPEPITVAASGSDAFDIKRHGNRVFIEPIRANVSTNLFLWTAHGESVYELEPAGEVNTMNVLIAPKPQTQVATVAATVVSDSEIQKIADMAMSKALLQSQHVSQRDAKPLRDGVTVQVEDVVRAKDSLYVRYRVINTGKTPYRVLDPTVESVRPTHPTVSLQTLTNAQLNDKTVNELGPGQATNVPVVHSEIEDKDVAAGSVTIGVITLRVPSSGPQLYRLIFAGDPRQVLATVVL
jgi:hypothetical protein